MKLKYAVKYTISQLADYIPQSPHFKLKNLILNYIPEKYRPDWISFCISSPEYDILTKRIK
jgi:hypothetical protein